VHIQPHEIERQVKPTYRHDSLDRRATLIVDAVVTCAMAIYFIASAFSLFFD
jgi:hypothetical protein